MKTMIALAIAAAAFSTSALADTVTNSGSTYDVKVQYRIPGKTYHLQTEVYGTAYDTPKATVFPYEEVLVAPGKSVTVDGKIIKTINMIPGPDMTKFFAEHSLG